MATTDGWLEVVCDAGPLIHLDELGCLDLLGDFRIVYLPAQVWGEVEHHRPSALQGLPPCARREEIHISTSSVFQALLKTFSLDLGEQAALSLLERLPEAILLTDDSAARLAAQALGHRVHGSLGVLLRSIRRRQRTRPEVLEILRSLPERSTLHLRADLLQGIIDQVEQMDPA